MNETYFGTIKTRIITACSNVNTCAADRDANRNRVNYGETIALGAVLRDMGHTVNIPVWEDDGFLKIPKLVIDAWEIEFGK